MLEFLERLLSTAHARSATSINTCARRYLQLRRFSVLRQTAILVQRRRRGFVRRRSFIEPRRSLYNAASGRAIKTGSKGHDAQTTPRECDETGGLGQDAKRAAQVLARARFCWCESRLYGEGSSLWCSWISYDGIKRSARRWSTNLPICGGASMKRKSKENGGGRLSSDTLTDESTRMLDYLRTEVVALTRTCDALRRENDILRTHHERGQQARASAQQSVAAVAAHVRFLGDKNASIKNENRQLLKATAVLKEELAMRQAIYLNQVAQNAKLRRVMESMVDTADVRGCDRSLLEELRVLADLPLHEDSIDEEPVVEVVDQRPGFFGRLFGGSQKRSWIGNAPSPGNKARGPDARAVPACRAASTPRRPS